MRYKINYRWGPFLSGSPAAIYNPQPVLVKLFGRKAIVMNPMIAGQPAGGSIPGGPAIAPPSNWMTLNMGTGEVNLLSGYISPTAAQNVNSSITTAQNMLTNVQGGAAATGIYTAGEAAPVSASPGLSNYSSVGAPPSAGAIMSPGSSTGSSVIPGAMAASPSPYHGPQGTGGSMVMSPMDYGALQSETYSPAAAGLSATTIGGSPVTRSVNQSCPGCNQSGKGGVTGVIPTPPPNSIRYTIMPVEPSPPNYTIQPVYGPTQPGGPIFSGHPFHGAPVWVPGSPGSKLPQ